MRTSMGARFFNHGFYPLPRTKEMEAATNNEALALLGKSFPHLVTPRAPGLSGSHAEHTKYEIKSQDPSRSYFQCNIHKEYINILTKNYLT